MYKLYYTEAALDLTDEGILLSRLDENRRARIGTRPQKDRISAAAASCLLRYALYDTGNGAFIDAPITWEGKPCFADPIIPLYFNLSHTVDSVRGVFAAAVLLSDEDEVGVDIEFIREIHNRDALMRRLFTAAEREYVLSSDGESAFFDIWCAKEAFIKLTGTGFSRRMSTLSADIAAGKMTGEGLSCDLLWMTVGDCRLCCAAEHLPQEMNPEIVTPENLIVLTEKTKWNESSMSI